MLDTLITSKTRLKLLVKFFVNPSVSSYLRNLAVEFGESTNGIRLELNRLEKAGLLTSYHQKNRKLYSANSEYLYYKDIRNLVFIFTGLSQIHDGILAQVKNLKQAWLIGSLANGIDVKSIDILLVGEEIDREQLHKLTEKVEKTIKRKVNYIIPEVYNESFFLKDYPEKMLILETGI